MADFVEDVGAVIGRDNANVVPVRPLVINDSDGLGVNYTALAEQVAASLAEATAALNDAADRSKAGLRKEMTDDGFKADEIAVVVDGVEAVPAEPVAEPIIEVVADPKAESKTIPLAPVEVPNEG